MRWKAPDISADELDAPVRGIGWLMAATLAFALVPVQDGDTKEWSLGVLQNPGQYAAVLSFGIGGLILYRLLCRRWRGSQAFARRMTAVVLALCLRVQHGTHRHRQVRPVAHRQRPCGAVHLCHQAQG